MILTEVWGSRRAPRDPNTGESLWGLEREMYPALVLRLFDCPSSMFPVEDRPGLTGLALEMTSPEAVAISESFIRQCRLEVRASLWPQPHPFLAVRSRNITSEEDAELDETDVREQAQWRGFFDFSDQPPPWQPGQPWLG